MRSGKAQVHVTNKPGVSGAGSFDVMWLLTLLPYVLWMAQRRREGEMGGSDIGGEFFQR